MRLAYMAALCGIAASITPAWGQKSFRPEIPKTWDEEKLADWATPLAGIDTRPTHISPEKYYSLPVDNLKTYPVYLLAANRLVPGKYFSGLVLSPFSRWTSCARSRIG